MARTLSAGLAPVVEELELERPELVTTASLSEIVARHGVRTPVRVVASRLRERGWLLATGERGVWEFAPAAHAGPIGRGQATLPLQAALRRRPDLECGLTFQSAAWARGLADRAPNRLEIAAFDPAAARVLKTAGRVSTFRPRLAPVSLRGVPVLALESVLVQLAAHPDDVKSWSSTVEWLPDVAAEADWTDMKAELADRPIRVTIRLGYLLDGVRPDLAAHLAARAAESGRARTVWFGSRDAPQRRHSRRWRVTDTLLPFDPADLRADSPR
jgi:predicted transcriptional regulator of viral defense system